MILHQNIVIVFALASGLVNVAHPKPDEQLVEETLESLERFSLPVSNFSNVKLNASIPSLDEDDFQRNRNSSQWTFKKSIKGYEIMSSDVKVKTTLLEPTKIIKIEILTGSARMVEVSKVRRDVDIKISTWNKISKFRIRVPFGFLPDELSIMEKPRKIVILAPYGYIEFRPTPEPGLSTVTFT